MKVLYEFACVRGVSSIGLRGDVVLLRKMASAASSLLATILRDVDANPANVQGALSALRRRTLIAVVDMQTLDAWSSRLQALLRGPVPEARVAAAALLSETVQQCTQFEFARHREQWVAALLHLLQPISEATSEAAIAAATSVRLAAAEALAHMVTVSAGWPGERRELSGAVSRLASALVSMLGEATTQHGALLVLSRLSAAVPHSLRAHRDRLGADLPPIALEAGAPAARAAAALMGVLPSCLPVAAVEEAWLLHVQRLVGTMHRALALLLGAVVSALPVRYELPAYALPAEAQASVVAAPSSGTPSTAQSTTARANAAAQRRRSSLVRCVSRCALALHCGLCPPSTPADALPMPVPLELLVSTAAYILDADGLLPVRVVPVTEAALPFAEALLILPEVHLAAFQLLHSTVVCAQRHALGHVSTIAQLLRRTWQRTAPSGPPQLRCAELRAATYALSAVLLTAFGPCVVGAVGEALVSHALLDLTGQLPSRAGAAAAHDGGAGAGARKRLRSNEGGSVGGSGVAATGDAATGGGRPAPVSVQCAALSAVHALLLVGTELLNLALLGRLQRALLAACVDAAQSAPGTALHALLLSALGAAVGTGRAVHGDVLPRAIAVLQGAGVRAPAGVARAAAFSALHASDALVHPGGVACWSLPAEEERAADAAARPGASTTPASTLDLSSLAPLAAAGGARSTLLPVGTSTVMGATAEASRWAPATTPGAPSVMPSAPPPPAPPPARAAMAPPSALPALPTLPSLPARAVAISMAISMATPTAVPSPAMQTAAHDGAPLLHLPGAASATPMDDDDESEIELVMAPPDEADRSAVVSDEADQGEREH